MDKNDYMRVNGAVIERNLSDLYHARRVAYSIERNKAAVIVTQLFSPPDSEDRIALPVMMNVNGVLCANLAEFERLDVIYRDAATIFRLWSNDVGMPGSVIVTKLPIFGDVKEEFCGTYK